MVYGDTETRILGITRIPEDVSTISGDLFDQYNRFKDDVPCSRSIEQLLPSLQC